jgi:hypothetical protein
LALVCATALLAGTIEVMLVPLYHGATVLPITVLLGMATTFALPRLGIWLTRTPSGGFLPLACWFVAVLGLAFIGRPEGDVLVEGGNAQQWVLFVLIIASAVVGFVTVVRSTEALAPVRQPDGPPVSR